MNICIYGASSAELEQIYYEKTEELGKMMAKRGHGLVFGGGATGMMGAAARGVDSEDGYILGIAPRFFDKPGVLYENCSEFIFTETMRERKKLLEERSDATIVTPGGIGTYEEFFEILTLKSLHRLDRPIVLYNINGYYDGMKALLQHTADEKFMDASNMELCAFMDDPEQILAYIENYKKITGRTSYEQKNCFHDPEIEQNRTGNKPHRAGRGIPDLPADRERPARFSPESGQL